MSRQGILTTVLAVVCASALTARQGAGSTFETLLMPGPVIEAHAETEEDCAACHSPFDREAEDGLCLACHEPVAEDRATKTGFHFRAPGVLETPCRSCHTDHEGRAADVVGLNPGTFDHDYTDYPLRGAHGALACSACHAQGEMHRDAPTDCVGCHRTDDPHRAALGDACADCHVDSNWAEARFDHGDTDFPLEGGHVDVPCGSCHADERYEATPEDCGSCHRLDDVHRGRYGAGCESCHAVSAWDTLSFEHDRDTSFPLKGSHATTACDSCHPGDLYAEPAPSDCASCHVADDVHRGQLGDDCSRCHGEAKWSRILFDHDTDTEFALRGAHSSIRCESCHEGNVYQEELGSTCITCHSGDDVHAGQEGERCETCHSETSWHGDLRFDHELTSFPLLGLHATVACEECHASFAFRDAPGGCVDCHRAADVHEDRLGRDCARCHTPNGWQVWRFDHDTETTFALHGAHKEIDCRGCHTTPVADAGIDLPNACGPCHTADDAHRGAFGSDCERCHGEQAWSDLNLLP